jgi:2-oxo-hept-3-ene-1,7-dioate hydratase
LIEYRIFMLSEATLRQCAQDLYNAEATQSLIPQLSQTHPHMTLQDAYAVQGHWAELHTRKGAKIVGHKIGLTSRAMQVASNFYEPDFGTLLDSMLFADGATIPAGRFKKPRLEVELSFVMGKDLSGGHVQIYDVLRATEFIQPALEIIDYRTEVPRQMVDTIADNAASGGMVIGGRTIRPFDVDLRWVGATLSQNGVIEETGLAAGIMGHPAAGVAWLVRKLNEVGEGLKAGQLVLAGSFTRPIQIKAGDVVHADYGPLGAIAVRFA